MDFSQTIDTIRLTLMTDERLTKKNTEILRAGLFTAFSIDTLYFTILHSMCSCLPESRAKQWGYIMLGMDSYAKKTHHIHLI